MATFYHPDACTDVDAQYVKRNDVPFGGPKNKSLPLTQFPPKSSILEACLDGTENLPLETSGGRSLICETMLSDIEC